MTTVKKIIKNIKTVLRKEFKIVKSEIKMIRHDVFAIHLPIPTKVSSFPSSSEHNVFVPVSFGPEGIDLTVRLPLFEQEFGLMSDHPAAELALKGLYAGHPNEFSEVRVSVLRDYVTDDYVRSHIGLTITVMPDVDFQVDPWFHLEHREGNTIVLSIDADVVFDVYCHLWAEAEKESVITPA